MKKYILTLLLSYVSIGLFANGICIVNAENGTYLDLVSSSVEVTIRDQVATVRATQSFINTTGAPVEVKYGFPMGETASATSLRWKNDGFWYTADFSPSPQDSTIIDSDTITTQSELINTYLGKTPLLFKLDQMVFTDSIITFELVYVQLLPYEFGKVSFDFPNSYELLDQDQNVEQELRVDLYSQRSIESIELLSHFGAIVNNDSNSATLEWTSGNSPADADYALEYSLNADEFGLWGLSTFLTDSTQNCDSLGNGFFAFIVEPDPSDNTEVIEKAFTLIIDQSGSMSGEKMIQAREAASFIVDNMNLGDIFNVISFDNEVRKFKSDHVPVTLSTQNEALAFIASLEAEGSTNISGAFSAAIPEFSDVSDEKAQIIVFFTDGKASAGISDTDPLLEHVRDLVVDNDVEDLSIFTFGIGQAVNQRLLSLLASQNNGLSDFLDNQDLATAISNFYLTIQNPVLLNTTLTFDPSEVVIEDYPQLVPNLFKGQQLIVVGRYSNPQQVQVLLEGVAFGSSLSYDYPLTLTGSTIDDNQFLTKLWAKKKLEHLFNQYIGLPLADSLLANQIHDEIVDISLCYGVISPLTSFEDNSGGVLTSNSPFGYSALESTRDSSMDDVRELFSWPNPFEYQTQFSFRVNENIKEEVMLNIYDEKGEKVASIIVVIDGPDLYRVTWDGLGFNQLPVAQGIYMVQCDIGSKNYLGKVIKIR